MIEHDAGALRAKLQGGGFTPGARDLAGLVELLAGDDDTAAILRALERTPEAATRVALARFDTATGGMRARLCEFVGRMARRDPTVVPWILERLRDDDALVRRRAATALGKLEDPAHEACLVDAWGRAGSDPERKVVAAALGQSGGAAALALLGALPPVDPEFDRVVRESVLKLERGRLRGLGSTIVLDAAPADAVTIELGVRPGLEAMVCEQLGGAAKVGRGRVRLAWSGSLAALFAARTFVDVAFVLPPVPLRTPSPAEVESAVVRALASDLAFDIMTTWTRGPLRWRLEWTGQGHRRASTWRVVEAMALGRPELVNDPRDAPWEARITVERDQVRCELRPRGLVDPRFGWRRGSVPASSHPSIAAALARTAGVRHDDVVWDPFVGAGAELVERGLLGPHDALYGSDHDPAAIDVARQNLDAAGLTAAVLAVADATTHRPPRRPTLVITNPPMGHRVRAEGSIGDLLDRALGHWLGVLEPGGRIVWLSPVADRTAGHRGVECKLRQTVDLGGLAAELQVLEPRVVRPGYGRRREVSS